MLWLISVQIQAVFHPQPTFRRHRCIWTRYAALTVLRSCGRFSPRLQVLSCPRQPLSPSANSTSAVSAPNFNPDPSFPCCFRPVITPYPAGLPATASGGPVVVKVLVRAPLLSPRPRVVAHLRQYATLPPPRSHHSALKHRCRRVLSVDCCWPTPMPLQLSAARHIPLHMRAHAAPRCLSRAGARTHQQHPPYNRTDFQFHSHPTSQHRAALAMALRSTSS